MFECETATAEKEVVGLTNNQEAKAQKLHPQLWSSAEVAVFFNNLLPKKKKRVPHCPNLLKLCEHNTSVELANKHRDDFICATFYNTAWMLCDGRTVAFHALVYQPVEEWATVVTEGRAGVRVDLKLVLAARILQQERHGKVSDATFNRYGNCYFSNIPESTPAYLNVSIWWTSPK